MTGYLYKFYNLGRNFASLKSMSWDSFLRINRAKQNSTYTA